MKKIVLSILAMLLLGPLRADEGMWIPMLIGKNIADMQRMGLRLTASDIYDINHASLKDAVVQFGGGCTAELISPNGLLITNHHCGYASITELSTVAHNYLENGFWAKSYDQELPAKGLTVKFLVRMEDVTTEMNAATSRKKERRKEKSFLKAKEELEQKASENGKYQAVVTPYFNGNQYILLVYQIYNDVRLVATPPKALGKFGGDTDNWMWPRHTCDFSMFRVYADKNNNPAPYSRDNVPYRPKKYLPVSIKGVHENDFAMIMGYPGRTNRYETSYGVDMAINITNPSIVKIRDMRLAIMRKKMRQDPAVNLKLASIYAQVANYWKYYIGQTEQLERLHVLSEKQAQERNFADWSAKNHKGYDDLMTRFAKLYAAYRPYARGGIYYREAFGASALSRLGAATHKLYQVLSEKHVKAEAVKEQVDRLRAERAKAMETFVPGVEQELFARMAQLYYEDVPKSQLPDIYQKLIFKQFTRDSLPATFDNFAQYTFAHSFLLDDARFEAFCNHPTREALDNDPATAYALSFVDNYDDFYQQKEIDFTTNRNLLAKMYTAGLMEEHPGKLFYPDANSTMRLTYGKVSGYSPKDAVYYNYFTTIDGLLAKYKPGDDEFDLPDDFLRLARSGDYGPYADADGKLVTCFITNNDITGGNSGSPVINAQGALLGLAFDGNWEAMSGDIAFDKQYKRTIAVDIRFVLWLIDKYGKAGNLIREMTIVD